MRRANALALQRQLRTGPRTRGAPAAHRPARPAAELAKGRSAEVSYSKRVCVDPSPFDDSAPAAHRWAHQAAHRMADAWWRMAKAEAHRATPAGAALRAHRDRIGARPISGSSFFKSGLRRFGPLRQQRTGQRTRGAPGSAPARRGGWSHPRTPGRRWAASSESERLGFRGMTLQWGRNFGYA